MGSALIETGVYLLAAGVPFLVAYAICSSKSDPPSRLPGALATASAQFTPATLAPIPPLAHRPHTVALAPAMPALPLTGGGSPPSQREPLPSKPAPPPILEPADSGGSRESSLEPASP